MRPARLLLLIAALAVAVWLLWPSQGEVVLEGTVLERRCRACPLHPAPGAALTLSNAADAFAAPLEAKSDAQGRYSLKLPAELSEPGLTLLVEARSKDGRARSQRSFVLRGEHEVGGDVDFELWPPLDER